jgi:hypothetical protein
MRKKVKQPESCSIGGMECLGRRLAADYIHMSLSTLDKVLRLTRIKKAKVPIKYIQYTKTAPIWFPVEWLDSFVLDVMKNGGAF